MKQDVHELTAPTRVEPLLWNTRDAAKALAIGTRKLWELTNCGEIPCVRIGTCVRYSPDELRVWIRDRKGNRN